MMSIRPFTVILGGVLFTSTFAAQGEIKPKDVKLLEPNLRSWRPFSYPQGKYMCFIMVLPDCPIANQYAPEIKRISSAYSKKGIDFSIVYVDPKMSGKQALDHAKAYGYDLRVLRDPKHYLPKFAGASRSPEAAVFDKSGKRLYVGRIDNLFAEVGKKRAKATTHDLKTALDQVLAGKPVTTAKTEAVGCLLPRP